MSRVFLKNQEPLVTIDGFLSTYRDSNNFAAQRMKDFLENKSLLPLTYNSPLFPELNILVSAVIWSGSNSETSSHRPRVSLSLDELTTKSLEDGISGLDVTLTPLKDHYTLGQNGSAYTRLISQIPGMFVSRGTKDAPEWKAYHEVTLPDYYTFLMDHYSHIHNEDKRIARKVIVDNLNMLLQTRGPKRKETTLYYRLKLLENISEDVAKSFAKQVLKMFNTVYPKIGLTKDSVQKYETSRKTGDKYAAVIKFKKEHILNAIEHYDIFIIELNRRFQPLDKRLIYKG